MDSWQSTFLGRRTFPADLNDHYIQTYFTFSADEIQALTSEFYAKNRVAAALQYGYLRLAGTELEAIKFLPKNLLRHVCEQLDVPAPTNSALRAQYSERRLRQRFVAWAADRQGWKRPSLDTDRKLDAYLGEIARTVVSKSELLDRARRWSYDNRFLLRADSAYERVCGSKFADSEEALFKEIDARVPAATRAEWIKALLETKGTGRATVLEWLKTPPSGRGHMARKDVSDKIEFLKGLGVHRGLIQTVPPDRIRYYAAELGNRKPSRLERLTDPLKALELVSFLWHSMMRNTDMCIHMSRKEYAKIKGSCRAAVTLQRAASSLELMRGLEEIEAVVENKELDLESTRAKTLEIIRRFRAVNPNTSEATRELLLEEHHKIDALVRPLIALDLESNKDGVAIQSIEMLRDLMDRKKRELPSGDAPCRDPWDKLVNQNDDPDKAYKAFVTATLEEAHRALRHGEVFIDHSENHRDPDNMLIAPKVWEKTKRRYYSELGQPERVDDCLKPFLDQLPKRLKELADAVKAKVVTIDAKRMSISPIEPEKAPAGYKDFKRLLAAEIGPIQLPEMALMIDAETRFSWKLLGRQPRDKLELISVYAALLVNGTNMSAKAVSMMIPGLTDEQIKATMHLIEPSKHTRAANAAIVDFMLRHRIVEEWGGEAWASSDMMSLETSRKLYNARLDPRLKTPAIGTYTHTSGRWGILYDAPIVVGPRQNGVAIEGYLRQYSQKIQHLGVDTHGYSNWSIALAKLLRLDLFPRLRDLDERKLFVPHGTVVPPELESVTRFISLKAFKKHYDDMMRVAGSVKDGTLTAVQACQMYGSDAVGDQVRKAGEQFGQLLRTLFLCDYYTKPDFRRELHRVLNRGESVHVLQRAIYSGRMPHMKGRTDEAMIAISGSLALLANLVMAWTTRRMQMAVESMAKRGIEAPPGVIAHTGPARLWNVNLRGTLHFPIDDYAEQIFGVIPKDNRWSATPIVKARAGVKKPH